MTLNLDAALTTAQHDAAMDFLATISAAAFHTAARLNRAGLPHAEALRITALVCDQAADLVRNPNAFRAELLKEPCP